MPTFTSQPDGASGIDTFLNEAQPTQNNGTNVFVGMRTVAGGRRVGLLKFDVSSIPAGATVTSATLSLWNESTFTTDRGFTAYSILAANGAWTEGGATWDTRDGANPWAGDTGGDGGTDAGCTVSGTDFNATPLATWTYVANTPQATEHQISLAVAQVQAWVDGANYGMAIVSDSSALFNWRSSDYGTAEHRPKLVIEYTAGGSTIQESVTLARSHAITGAAAASAAAVLTLARALGVTPVPAATSGAAISLGRVQAVAAAGGSTFQESVALTRALSALASATAQASPSLTLSLVRAIVPGAAATASDGVTLAIVRDAAAGAAAAVSESAAMARALGVSAAGGLVVSEALVLARALGAGAAVVVDATGALSLDAVRAIAAAGAATSDAGVTLARVGALTAAGLATLGSIVTPGERTYAVPAEARVYAVDARGRVYAIDREGRVYVVGA